MASGPRAALRSVVLVGQLPVEGSTVRDALHGVAENVLVAESVPVAISLARRSAAELMIALDDVPGPDALRLVTEMRASMSACRVVVVDRRPSVAQAVRFVKAGACDYVPAPLDAQNVLRVLEGLDDDLATPQDRGRFFCEACPPGVEIVGRSDGMVRCLETLRLVAESRCDPVLLLGETGTGKELAAQAVHVWRCDGAAEFVAVNCAALTATLLESELFGHVKGAFTGADRDKTGLFELAGGGTIFLDEISEMPPELQAKLLRVLQERTFRKVGGTETLRCDATIVASSNRDLLAGAAAGRFRKDLYYRLAVFPVTLPPLRSPERRSDVPLLAAYFAETSHIRPRGQARTLTDDAEAALLAHDWPGNVRELRNVIERALILERAEQITPASLRLDGAPPAAPGPAKAPNRSRKDFSLETAEREFILRALKETGWQRTRAAALLGITRATLHAKLKRYDIQPPEAPPKAEPSRAEAPAELQGTGV